jgi:hypothetical protein
MAERSGSVLQMNTDLDVSFFYISITIALYGTEFQYRLPKLSTDSLLLKHPEITKPFGY